MDGGRGWSWRALCLLVGGRSPRHGQGLIREVNVPVCFCLEQTLSLSQPRPLGDSPPAMIPWQWQPPLPCRWEQSGRQ